jgi:hypothetical protein
VTSFLAYNAASSTHRIDQFSFTLFESNTVISVAVTKSNQSRGLLLLLTDIHEKKKERGAHTHRETYRRNVSDLRAALPHQIPVTKEKKTL